MLPNKFSFLNNISPLPKMVAMSLSMYGSLELPGTNNNNPIIMGMARDLGLSKQMYPNDETSWCGLFMCWLCWKNGKPMPFKGYDILRAKSFLKWGNPVPLGQEMLGDILVFKRPGGFHVTQYVAESKTTFFGLGGNQRNSINIAELGKDRFEGARRFYAIAPPSTVKKYLMDSTGMLSVNEA